ncbi:hypothetical protein MNBD_GAMMA09-1624, partial [hydrothermal vent metagenome]
ACHSTNSWSPATRVDHNEVNGTCSSCHNGTIAKGAPNPHYSSTQCDVCHSTNNWNVSRYTHGLSYEPTNHAGSLSCDRCHLQNTNTVSYPDNPGLAPDCAACHTHDYDPSEHLDVSASSLRDCSGSCHEPGPEHRVSDPDWG